MNKLKNKNGITLVALVVTIIILLILAGISIATLTGSGLFEKARLVEQKSKQEQEKEQGILGDYENKIKQHISSTRDNINYNFSEKEQFVGKWIDGKDLYTKTLHFTVDISTGSYKILDNDFSYIDTMVEMEGYGINSNMNYCGVGGIFYSFTDNKKIQINNINYGNNITEVYITIKYTKV